MIALGCIDSTYKDVLAGNSFVPSFIGLDLARRGRPSRQSDSFEHAFSYRQIQCTQSWVHAVIDSIIRAYVLIMYVPLPACTYIPAYRYLQLVQNVIIFG